MATWSHLPAHRADSRGSRAIARAAALVCLAICLTSCTYLRYASVQNDYKRIQSAQPAQLNVKHMIDRSTFFVHGRCIDPTGRFDTVPKAIAAFSSRYRPNERVDAMPFQVAGSHYGLNLPEGTYDLLVFADLDDDGVFESSEVVGERSIELDDVRIPQKVLGQIDVELGEPVTVDSSVAFDAPAAHALTESVFYPAGTLRSLQDPIFDRSFSTLGMYDPASFLEQAPTMFYALEEDAGYKIPVIFVHGIDGSARDFLRLVEGLDRDRYKAWFFHYPSGGDLDQLSELFYQIFLSGKVYQASGMPLICVAHSMGGLIVREAINRYQGMPKENQLHLLVTMASPFGGHPAAASAEKHGLIVLPSWRDLNPTSAFIDNLFRRPLPPSVHHDLLYAFQDPATIKLGENSDGVVPLSSQLDPRAQSQASNQFGFDTTHTGILDRDDVAAYVMRRMNSVENPFPQSHLRVLQQGGYDVALGTGYTPMAAYLIHTNGKYLMALSDGTLEPFNAEQRKFVEVAQGQRPPRSSAEKDWVRFIAEHPELRDVP